MRMVMQISPFAQLKQGGDESHENIILEPPRLPLPLVRHATDERAKSCHHRHEVSDDDDDDETQYHHTKNLKKYIHVLDETVMPSGDGGNVDRGGIMNNDDNHHKNIIDKKFWNDGVRPSATTSVLSEAVNKISRSDSVPTSTDDDNKDRRHHQVETTTTPNNNINDRTTTSHTEQTADVLLAELAQHEKYPVDFLYTTTCGDSSDNEEEHGALTDATVSSTNVSNPNDSKNERNGEENIETKGTINVCDGSLSASESPHHENFKTLLPACNDSHDGEDNNAHPLDYVEDDSIPLSQSKKSDIDNSQHGSKTNDQGNTKSTASPSDDTHENKAKSFDVNAKGLRSILKKETNATSDNASNSNLNFKIGDTVQQMFQHLVTTTATPTKVVKFSTLSIREYPVVEGDHPCCRIGPALELGWDVAHETPNVPIDFFEALRTPKWMIRTKEERDAVQKYFVTFHMDEETMKLPRRHRHQLRLRPYTRQRWLATDHDDDNDDDGDDHYEELHHLNDAKEEQKDEYFFDQPLVIDEGDEASSISTTFFNVEDDDDDNDDDEEDTNIKLVFGCPSKGSLKEQDTKMLTAPSFIDDIPTTSDRRHRRRRRNAFAVGSSSEQVHPLIAATASTAEHERQPPSPSSVRQSKKSRGSIELLSSNSDDEEDDEVELDLDTMIANMLRQAADADLKSDDDEGEDEKEETIIDDRSIRIYQCHPSVVPAANISTHNARSSTPLPPMIVVEMEN